MFTRSNSTSDSKPASVAGQRGKEAKSHHVRTAGPEVDGRINETSSGFAGQRNAAQPAANVQTNNIAQTAQPMIQRFAFVNDQQLYKGDAGLDPQMEAFADDQLPRNYTSLQEFSDHANSRTDHLGNLVSGPAQDVWVRFNDSGLNVLGEFHTHVTLSHVTRTVGTTNFIRERFATDTFATQPNTQAQYEAENASEFQDMGIDAVPNKEIHGGESIFPKIGYALNDALERNLLDAANVAQISAPRYFGKPLQRYLKLGWAWAKDIEAEVAALRLNGSTIPPEKDALAQLVTNLTGQLDAFITGLQPNGYLGDALGKPQNLALFPPIKRVAIAVVDVALAQAVQDPSSRLSQADRARLRSQPSTRAEKSQVFADWRNYNIEDAVTQAAANGVRYAGMGGAHLDYLKAAGTLPGNATPYDIRPSGPDLAHFISESTRILGLVSPNPNP